MAIVVLLIAATASAAPILATALVSLASRREDRAWSLCGQPRDRATALARHIVDFHAEGSWPQPRDRWAADRPSLTADLPANGRPRQAAVTHHATSEEPERFLFARSLTSRAALEDTGPAVAPWDASTSATLQDHAYAADAAVIRHLEALIGRSAVPGGLRDPLRGHPHGCPAKDDGSPAPARA